MLGQKHWELFVFTSQVAMAFSGLYFNILWCLKTVAWITMVSGGIVIIGMTLGIKPWEDKK